MRSLLDTHIFLWALEDNPKLNPIRREFLENADNVPVLSVVSLWELSVKMSIGKLTPKRNMTALVNEHVVGKGVELLAIKPVHLDGLTDLPLHHRDPFGRLLLSQAMAEAVPLMSNDTAFEAYGVSLL